MEQLSTAMPSQLMKADLNLESAISILLVNFQILVTNEGNLFIRGFGTKDVAEGYILESFGLPDIVVLFPFRSQPACRRWTKKR